MVSLMAETKQNPVVPCGGGHVTSASSGSEETLKIPHFSSEGRKCVICRGRYQRGVIVCNQKRTRGRFFCIRCADPLQGGEDAG